MRPTGEFEVAFENLDQPEQSWDDVVTGEIERVTDALRQISERA